MAWKWQDWGSVGALRKVGDPFLIYLPDGGTTNLNITGIDTTGGAFPTAFLRVFWYNPRTGDSVLQMGPRLEMLMGGGNFEQGPVSIGNPPSDISKDWVAMICRDTVASFVQLSSPANGADTGAANLAQTLSWSQDFNAVSYRLQVSTSTGFSSTLLDSAIADPSVTQVAISGLAPSTKYFWRVYEAYGSGTTDWSQTFNFSTPADLTLSLPIDGAVDVPLNPALSWHPVAGATGYRVQVSKDRSDFTNVVKDTTIMVTDTSVILFNDTNRLVIGGQYYWRAREIRTSGTIAAWSSGFGFTATNTGVIPAAVRLNSLHCAMSKGILNYALPRQCYVSVTYYDLRGRIVGSFVNQEQAAGYYSLSVPVSRWSRGMYIQIFKAGTFIKKDKLVLLK
jgi:hypothetical protein